MLRQIKDNMGELTPNHSDRSDSDSDFEPSTKTSSYYPPGVVSKLHIKLPSTIKKPLLSKHRATSYGVHDESNDVKKLFRLLNNPLLNPTDKETIEKTLDILGVDLDELNNDKPSQDSHEFDPDLNNSNDIIIFCARVINNFLNLNNNNHSLSELTSSDSDKSTPDNSSDCNPNDYNLTYTMLTPQIPGSSSDSDSNLTDDYPYNNGPVLTDSDESQNENIYLSFSEPSSSDETPDDASVRTVSFEELAQSLTDDDSNLHIGPSYSKNPCHPGPTIIGFISSNPATLYGNTRGTVARLAAKFDRDAKAHMEKQENQFKKINP